MSFPFRLRHVILVSGIVNAALYSALLPLWEGFDEAFHYAYVESLWQTKRLPVLGRTPIPKDVDQSFGLAPLSHVVQRVIPEASTFDAWFSLPPAEKDRRRGELDRLHPDSVPGSRKNYEAHHPPLAYMPLALLDWSFSKASIRTRVLALRLFASVLSVVLLYFGAAALCRTLDLPANFANAALFTIFCSQMLYASIAHVANDWLAIPIACLFLAALAEFTVKPDRRSGLKTAAWLTAGLLTKAYFLVFVALALATAAVMLWRRRTHVRILVAAALPVLIVAGPWYFRNLILYGNVSGTHEEFDGIGLQQALAVAPRIDWLATTGFLARASLWTGNNSFTSFSRATLNIVLALLFVSLAAWCLRRRAILPPERLLFASIVLFSAAVAYGTCASFADRHGDVAGASPWYTQVLLAPVLVLAYAGLSRWKSAGSVLAAASVALWAWIPIATWTVKLFPMYSGAGAAPMRLREVWNWYLHDAAAHAGDLTRLALAPAPVLYAGLLVSLMLTAWLCAAIIRDLA